MIYQDAWIQLKVELGKLIAFHEEKKHNVKLCMSTNKLHEDRQKRYLKVLAIMEKLDKEL